MNKYSLAQLVLISVVSLTSLVYFAWSANYEFIIYVFVLFAFFYFIIRSDKRFEYPKVATWGLMVWAILHMAGGAVYVGGIRLYDLLLLDLIGEPYNILRYDQTIHFYAYLIIGILVYSILRRYFKEEDFLSTLLVVFAASGIGAFYEIVEFSTVVLFAYTGVGGFYNLMLDLCFNFLGAVCGVLTGKAIFRE